MPNEFPDQIPLQTVVFIVNKLAMELSSKFQNSTATRPSIIFYILWSIQLLIPCVIHLLLVIVSFPKVCSCRNMLEGDGVWPAWQWSSLTTEAWKNCPSYHCSWLWSIFSLQYRYISSLFSNDHIWQTQPVATLLSDELRNPDLHSATFRRNLKTFLFWQYLVHWAH